MYIYIMYIYNVYMYVYNVYMCIMYIYIYNTLPTLLQTCNIIHHRTVCQTQFLVGYNIYIQYLYLRNYIPISILNLKLT